MFLEDQITFYFRFFFIDFGVLGVGSVVYLPEKKDPPFLEITPPNGAATVATLPEPVAPALAFSQTNSYALIEYFYHSTFMYYSISVVHTYVFDL